MGFDRRRFLGAFAPLAALIAAPPAFAQGEYFANNVGSWTKVPSASEMKKDFVRLEQTYSLRFFQYLARLLLNYDPTSATWWENKVKELPPPSVSLVPDLTALIPVVGDDGRVLTHI